MKRLPVILWFDDSLDNTYTTAMPIMEEYGYRGVLSVITGLIGSLWHDMDPNGVDWGYRKLMTLDQVKELSRMGWDITSHSVLHSYFPNLSYYEALYELLCSREWIVKNIGVSPLCFAWPWGAVRYRETALTIYYFERTVKAGFWDGRTRSIPIASDLPPAGKISILLLHGIRTGGDPWELTPNQFRELLNKIESSGERVITLSEVVKEWKTNPLTYPILAGSLLASLYLSTR